ncbi:MAG: heme lyase CcmF/NrfE family subunit [Parvularculaceae bacterium]|nr:heme lyase CcmF/NrfE family subunit [Parvularculaceae bacterium]
MTAEIGQVFLILALLAALYQGLFPLVAAGAGDAGLMRTARSAALVQGLLVAAAFAALTVAHATSDFSVRNVVENSHTAKPFIYKLTGVWGNHEGSMLLWALILAGYGAAVALLSKRNALTARALAIQGLIAAAFLAFIIFTSNPFARVFPAPADGQDLNPLLQDPGLIIHPPFLYLGYVGFSIAFSYAVAGLISGRIDEDWARAARPWAMAAWTFLTIGIGLGSWWAYYELGWGGFWAWDPVENASFMPWLAGTALIHSMRVLEVRGAFKAWTVLLAILAFSLSLVGTFLVRSGILTSVHAFATDPERGLFILLILVVFIGGALLLFALRAHAMSSDAAFNAVSREGGLLVNNVVFVASTATVFIGTFYPLFVDVVSGEKLSVGAPYFNIVFLPFMAFALLIIAPASALAWKRGNLKDAVRRVAPAALAGLAALVLALWLASPKTIAAAAGAGLAAWAGAGVIADFVRRVRLFETHAGARVAALPKSYVAMTIAHLGFAVVAIGVLGAGVWKSETIAYAREGDTISVGGFDATLTTVREVQGPNYRAEVSTFAVARDGKALPDMTAERRFYPVRGMQTTEAAIATDLGGDLYLTVGEFNAERGWVVRAWRHPLTLWMWIGAGLIAAGGLVGIGIGERRRVAAPSSAAQAAAA